VGDDTPAGVCALAAVEGSAPDISLYGHSMQEPRKVSRPARANTPLVRLVLDRLELARVAWAPRFLDLHEGKEVLSWLPGLPLESWTAELELLDDLARIVRHQVDLTAAIVPRGEAHTT